MLALPTSITREAIPPGFIGKVKRIEMYID
jgi:hypothetical protein